MATPTTAATLDRAKAVALERLLSIVQHSESEREARLAAAAILRIPAPDDDESRPAGQRSSPPQLRENPPGRPSSPTSAQVQALTRELSRSLEAIAATQAKPPRPAPAAALMAAAGATPAPSNFNSPAKPPHTHPPPLRS